MDVAPRRKLTWECAGPVRWHLSCRCGPRAPRRLRGPAWHCPRVPSLSPHCGDTGAAGLGWAGHQQGLISGERGALTATQKRAQPRVPASGRCALCLAACCSRLSFLNVFSLPCQSRQDARLPWKRLVKIPCSVLIIEFQPSRVPHLRATEQRPRGKPVCPRVSQPLGLCHLPSAPCRESGRGQWSRAVEQPHSGVTLGDKEDPTGCGCWAQLSPRG